MDQIGDAITGELLQRKNYLEGQTVETIYFGGGTPSLIETDDIEKILSAIHKHFRVEPDAEITLEANPDDLTPVKFTAFKNVGINRLSIGIQSFRQEDLDFLSRTHTSSQVTQCITDAQQAGFQNLSIDLIYGIPTLTDEGWKENLRKAFSFGIPHISAYSLTVEDKTPLELMIRKGKMRPVDENLSLSHFHILCTMMQEYGYEHYEVSNFCLPGAYSRHNTAYWQGKPYLGAGPSAHSYNGISRCWNVANLATYIETVTAGDVKAEQELLSPATQLNEYIMISLRTMWGCDLVAVRRKFGEEIAENLLLDALTFIESEQMIYREGKLVLTPEGLLFADGISAALFTEE
jgi:oxygen-independent coproporphyrinogen-3 oxidase